VTAIKPSIPYTYEDYKSLPESMDRRYELLGGELFMVPAPTTTHQRVSRNLELILGAYCKVHGAGEMLHAPVDVVFGQGKERQVAQPDIVFVRAERQPIIAVEEIRGAPDLVIEIVSPDTEERDRNYKKTLYARHGVREYWIVDPDARTVEAYRLGEQGYDDARVYRAGNPLTSALLPGLAIELADVFPS
jgi:Uma2 family endonuclease